jgi:hypothetical protein
MTMAPCPIWYGSKVFSALFVSFVFGWSVWNGATYYVDIFGKRFQKELEDLRAEVEKWQNSPSRSDPGISGTSTPYTKDKDIPRFDLETSDKATHRKSEPPTPYLGNLTKDKDIPKLELESSEKAKEE